MIKTELRGGGEVTRVIVRGNRSMGWYENAVFVASIGFISMGLAVVLAFNGFWLVLPFAGLEFLFLCWCFYKTLVRLEHLEVITIDQELITIERGFRSPELSIATPRHWSRLSFKRSANPFEVGILSLLVHNKSYRLGQALGKEEKHQLFLVLKAYFSPGNILVTEIG